MHCQWSYFFSIFKHFGTYLSVAYSRFEFSPLWIGLPFIILYTKFENYPDYLFNSQCTRKTQPTVESKTLMFMGCLNKVHKTFKDFGQGKRAGASLLWCFSGGVMCGVIPSVFLWFLWLLVQPSHRHVCTSKRPFALLCILCCTFFLYLIGNVCFWDIH